MSSIPYRVTYRVGVFPATLPFINVDQSQLQCDAVPINFKLFNRIQHTFQLAEDDDDDVAETVFEQLVTEEAFLVPRCLLSNTTTCATLMDNVLSKLLHVPEHVCPVILGGLYEKVTEYAALNVPILVALVDVTTLEFGNHIFDIDQVIDLVKTTRESMETYEGEFVPATTSAVEGLERMRVDNDGLEAEQGDQSCVICMEGSESDGNIGEQVLLCLPCLHFYHQDCINVKWLETPHDSCLLCRYPMSYNIANL